MQYEELVAKGERFNLRPVVLKEVRSHRSSSGRGYNVDLRCDATIMLGSCISQPGVQDGCRSKISVLSDNQGWN